MTLVAEDKTTLLQENSSAAIAVKVKNVLFATDFSATSESALPYAMAICRRFGSTLHAVHVLSDANVLMMTGGVDYVGVGTIYEDAHTEAKEKLERVATLFEGIPSRLYVRHGQVWVNLAGIVEENKVDLIVVGTHGRTGLGKLLLGSVAEDILRHAPCPVLTVGPNVSGRAKLPALRGKNLAPVELELNQIVYATNFGPTSPADAALAASLAGEFRARLTLIHVMQDFTGIGNRPGPIEEGLRRLKELLPEDADLQYAPETLLEFGDPAKRIVQEANDRETDLLVLGARAIHEMTGTTHLPWSTAHQVIAHATCPVLTVRG
jgi:nucleotide-binding universal stress UspA family protein